MRVLYGVVGEGMGHAIRSRVIIEHLLEIGHDIEVMASSRACDFLRKQFGDIAVNRIHGLHLIYEDNRVRRGKTLWSNVQAGIAGIPKNISAYFELIEDFAPQAVISDFESWTYLYGLTHRLPVLSIDNMQIINRCRIPERVVAGEEDAFRFTKAFVKGKLPFCSHYLITTFFHPEIRKKRTTLVPPILRREILDATVERGEHLLVYQTGEGYAQLADTLQSLGIECRVYGMRRNITSEQVEGNLRYRPFDETGFVADLASARAVIAGGGFTLMGETVSLRKPMLSVPLGGQFEQILNARYLQHDGFGRASTNLQDPEEVRNFLAELPRFEENLSRVPAPTNEHTFNALDHWLDKAQAGLA